MTKRQWSTSQILNDFNKLSGCESESFVALHEFREFFFRFFELFQVVKTPSFLICFSVTSVCPLPTDNIFSIQFRYVRKRKTMWMTLIHPLH